MNPTTKAIEALEEAKRNASGCTCHEAYKSRSMADPDCAACDFHEVMECIDQAISALKAQPVDAGKAAEGGPFKVVEGSYRDTWSVEGPDYVRFGIDNIHRAEQLADAINWSFRAGQASQSAGVLRKGEYDVLYHHLLNGGEAIGYTYDKDGAVSAARVRMASGRWATIEYVDDFGMLDAFETDEGKETFTAECQRLSLEWIPVSKEG